MAKLKGPLFSQQAKGKLSGAITYFMRNGKPQVTSITEPKKERSAVQTINTDHFRDGQDAWKDLTPEQKEYWEDLADEYNKTKPRWDSATGRCLFMRGWMAP